MESQYIPVCCYSDWNKVAENLNSEYLSLFTVNIRSLINKFSELLTYLGNTGNKFTFIVITETWLCKEKDKALELFGYESCSLYRQD